MAFPLHPEGGQMNEATDVEFCLINCKRLEFATESNGRIENNGNRWISIDETFAPFHDILSSRSRNGYHGCTSEECDRFPSLKIAAFVLHAASESAASFEAVQALPPNCEKSKQST
jgi:hypothetical protein